MSYLKPALAVVLSSVLASSLFYLILPVQAFSPDPGSWSNTAGCAGHTAAGDKTPLLVTISEVLGSAYPDQSLNGSLYQVDNRIGGIADSNSLLPPCSVVNSAGENVTVYVEIDSIELSHYQDSRDCTGTVSCYAGGYVFDPTSPHSCISLGCIQIEFAQSWLNTSQLPDGYSHALGKYSCESFGCGPETCLNERVSCLDIQGFVFWDNKEPVTFPHWELHPLTAWRLRLHPQNGVASSPTNFFAYYEIAGIGSVAVVLTLFTILRLRRGRASA